MRRIAILIILLFCGYVSDAQALLIANNNPGAPTGTNIYTGGNALVNAFTAATAGDIIYIVPSGNNYGSLDITKSITLYGGGLNPDKDGAVITTLISVSIQSSDVRVSGIYFTQSTFSNGQAINLNPNGSTITNIMIDKCSFGLLSRTTTGDLGNLIIQNCVAGNGNANNTATAITLETSYSNVRISHNIIYGNSGAGSGALNSMNGADIEHNLFIGVSSGSTQDAFDNVTNCNIRNNIFYGVEPTSNNTFSGNNFDNNISAFAGNNSFPIGSNGNTGNNNLVNTDPQLISIPFAQSWNNSNDPGLTNPGSPALGAADDLTDIGLSGGSSPFDIYFTSLPIVQVITVPATVSQGADMTVNVKAKGN